MSRTDLPPVTLLLQEIQSVTSSMRRNQRWSSSTSSFQSSSSPLPPAFNPRNAAKRTRALSGAKKGRLSIENVDDGDLMGNFVVLRRTLSGVKGQSRQGPEGMSEDC